MFRPKSIGESKREPVIGALTVSVAALSAGLAIANLANADIFDALTNSILIAVNAIALVAIWHSSSVLAPRQGLRNPALVVVGFLTMLYVGRPIYILVSGEAGTHQIGYMRFENISQLFVQTLTIMAVALVALALGFYLAPSNGLSRILRQRRMPHPRLGLRLSLLLLIGMVPAYQVFRQLQNYPKGWQEALAVRAWFFAGQNHLIVLMSVFRSAVLVWLIMLVTWPERRRRLSFLTVGALWIVSLVFDIMTGGRMELILRNILPFLVVASLTPFVKKRSYLFNILAPLTLLLVFAGYRAIFREGSQDSSLSVTTRVSAYLSDIPEFLLGGDESAAFDYLVATMQAVPSQVPHRGMETLWTIVAAPIPSSFLEAKPERTGTILTESLRPDLAERGGSIAFSGAADLYYSFGMLAIPLGFLVLGLACGCLLKGAISAINAGAFPAWPLAFAFVSAAAVLSVFRAELAESPLAIMRVGILVASYLLLTKPSPGSTS